MPFRDRVYGAVAGKTGLDPKISKLAADAAIQAVKSKLPAHLIVKLDAMLDSDGGNVLWGHEDVKEKPEVKAETPTPARKPVRPEPVFTATPTSKIDAPIAGKSVLHRIKAYWSK